MTTPPLPPWAKRPAAGPPAPGSPADQLLAAFVGPRWATYRRKFTPFFEDARFTPTWNWAAALLSPFWFLYRKLYLPFVFFALAPGLAVSLLFGGELPVRQVPNPLPGGGGPVTTLTPDAALVALGVLVSVAILAGGTANFLLYRRAVAALRVIGTHAAQPDAAATLLRRVGGTSWQAVGLGVLVMVVLRLLATVGAR